MKKSLILLTLIAFLSAFLIAPLFLQNSDGGIMFWILFPIGTALGILLVSWAGIIIADKANLQMPLIKRFERNESFSIKDFKLLLAPFIYGSVLGLVLGIINQFFDIPENPGNFLVRILSTPWAALVTEAVSHLLVMSLLVLLFKNNWVAIILSSILFVILFHLQGVDGNISITIYLAVMNFLGSILTGWFYWKRGFESAVVCHAAMHIFLVGIN